MKIRAFEIGNENDMRKIIYFFKNNWVFYETEEATFIMSVTKLAILKATLLHFKRQYKFVLSISSDSMRGSSGKMNIIFYISWLHTEMRAIKSFSNLFPPLISKGDERSNRIKIPSHHWRWWTGFKIIIMYVS